VEELKMEVIIAKKGKLLPFIYSLPPKVSLYKFLFKLNEIKIELIANYFATFLCKFEL
jgi:hypothetical protein